MNVYMYQAALYCEPCGVAIREKLAGRCVVCKALCRGTTLPQSIEEHDAEWAGGRALAYLRHSFTPYPTPETSSHEYTSDQYPKGPYVDGGGEADLPQHCDGCGVFLENPLTGEGYRYVEEQIAIGTGKRDVLRTWAEFYGLSAPSGKEE